MKNNAAQDSLHVKTIMGLRRLFADSYPEGGWLPPGREMARSFGVTHLTYRKALDSLAKDGYVQSFPKRGHHVVPAWSRRRKVGIVLGDGGVAPALQVDALQGAFAQLASRRMTGHLVQANAMAKLHVTALLHGVEGLLWFFPPPAAAKTVKDILAAGDLPLVLVQDVNNECLVPEACSIRQNLAELARLRTQAMLGRGHRRIALARAYEDAVADGTVALLAAAGVELSPKLCAPSPSMEPGRVAALVKRHKITGLLAEGGESFWTAMLLEELSALPEPDRPEVQVRWLTPGSPLCQRYPQARLVHLDIRGDHSVCELGAKVLADHLELGAPLVSTQPHFTINN